MLNLFTLYSHLYKAGEIRLSSNQQTESKVGFRAGYNHPEISHSHLKQMRIGLGLFGSKNARIYPRVGICSRYHLFRLTRSKAKNISVTPEKCDWALYMSSN